ncbi:MAG: hypothetical protein AB7O65_05185, partial [Candidatus Korobacteraceae bacterium]
ETVGTRQVSDLPLIRRDFTSLMGLGTGVSGGAAITFNGLGRAGANYTVDGTEASANGEERTSRAVSQIALVGLDGVQEVQATKGIIPAEYGGVLGGNVNIVTKSGTNVFHGSAFELFQNENFAARNPFQTGLTAAAPLSYHQFGGSAGGPIIKDRFFIFGTYEGYRETSQRTISQAVPTPERRAELIAAVPAYKEAIDWLPLPTDSYNPVTDDTAIFSGQGDYRSYDNQLTLKGDYRPTDTSNLAVTWTRGRPFQSNQASTGVNGKSNARQFVAQQDRTTISFVIGGSNWTSESRFGYNLNNQDRVDPIFSEIYAGGGTEEFSGLFGRRYPGIMFSSYGFQTPLGELYRTRGPIWTLEEKFARHLTSHALKFGVRYARTGIQRTNPETPIFAYAADSDALTNRPTQVTFTFGNGDYNSRNIDLGFFVQDDWRVSQKLVINLGLRYDYFSKMTAWSAVEGEEYGFYNLGKLLNTTTFQFEGARPADNPYESDPWVNLGPRIGFAYNPDGRSATVIRGGAGVMFSPLISGMQRESIGAPDVPYRVRFNASQNQALGLQFPRFNDDGIRASRSLGLPPYYAVFDPDLQNPYSMQVYLGVQRQLTNTLALETAFVGNRGVKYILHRAFNQPDRNVPGLIPNPSIPEGIYADNSQNTNYASWQSSLRKRFSNSFSANLHHTWGKAMATDDGDFGHYNDVLSDITIQDFNNPRESYGPAAGDITHRVVGDWVYELPKFSNFGSVLQHILGGWQVTGIFNAQTGQPVLMSQGEVRETTRPDFCAVDRASRPADSLCEINANGTPRTFNGVPVGVVDANTPVIYSSDEYKQGGAQARGRYLNPVAFAPVVINNGSRPCPTCAPRPNTGRAARPGTLRKLAIRTPGLWNVDLSVGKNFNITEAVKFLFRFDASNAFNHVNYTTVNTNINNSQFGRITGGGAPRNMQLNMRVTW